MRIRHCPVELQFQRLRRASAGFQGTCRVEICYAIGRYSLHVMNVGLLVEARELNGPCAGILKPLAPQDEDRQVRVRERCR